MFRHSINQSIYIYAVQKARVVTDLNFSICGHTINLVTKHFSVLVEMLSIQFSFHNNVNKLFTKYH